MPRDYKNINKQAQKADRKLGPFLGNLLSFVTGLSIGIFIAAYIFMQPDQSWLNSLRLAGPAVSDAGPDKVKEQENSKEPKEGTANLPLPKFEFYDVLRNRKLNISEKIASEQEQKSSATDTNNIYVIQIGSFNEYTTADQLKAQLALIGITSYITRVVINGQDTRHRVRIGPFEDPEKLRQTRRRLEDNDFEYMMLKLELEDNKGD